MAQDGFKPRGPTSASQPDAAGTNARTTAVFGIVKDNIDPTRAGRLQVYISDFGGDQPDNRDNWISVSYMTPFYGVTVPDAANTGWGKYTSNPSSYGMWFSPPDIESTVICVFINGDVNYGFWIGCVPQPEALTMVPAIGATENIVPNEGEANSYGGATRLPVTNINTNNPSIADSADYIAAAKPVHSYQAAIMSQQGILRDPVRGPISSSAQRETPSRVGWGVSTPGRPIYQGGDTDEGLAEKIGAGTPPTDENLRVIARRGGHSIVMDDGDVLGKDQLIRLRTSRGHQILMSDDGQTLMLLHSNGQSYIELGKEGTVDVYSTNSINLRTQGDLNLHADRNININAAKQLNLKAENIIAETEKEFSLRTGTNTKFYSLGKYTVKTESAMSFESAADSSFVSKNITYINGEKINLNTGSSSTIPEDVKPIPIIAHTDTLFDTVKGFAAAPGKLLSITSRAPAHAPWANAGQGVDVKVSLDASDNLPAAPTPAVEKTNQLAATLPTTAQSGVSPATSSAMPDVQAISTSIDKNTTSAMLGSVATMASNPSNPLSQATSNGWAVANIGGTTTQMAVGTFAQSPSQLVNAGILKAGSDKLVTGLLNSSIVNLGTPPDVSKILPPNLFTGKTGAENVYNYLNNFVAQGSAQVTNFQKAQTALATGGVISGKESPQQLAGLVMATAQTGLTATINALKVGKNFGLPGGPPSLDATASAALKAINSGALAAQVAQNVTGALGGISKSLTALSSLSSGNFQTGALLDAIKGVSGSAFNAILQQFKPLTANIPQNLRKIAQDNASSLAGLSSGTTPVLAGAAATASALASGLTSLPGGQKIVQGVINQAANAVNSLPGTASINNLATAAFQNVVQKVPKVSFPTLPPGAGALLQTAINSIGSGSAISGASAQLQSAIAALTSGGSIPIKLPTIGFNTTNRGNLALQVSNLFGNDKIPQPNFSGEISSAAEQSRDLITAKIDAARNVGKNFDLKAIEVTDARKVYYQKLQDLPPGDAAIEEAQQEWFRLNDELQALANQLKQLQI